MRPLVEFQTLVLRLRGCTDLLLLEVRLRLSLAPPELRVVPIVEDVLLRPRTLLPEVPLEPPALVPTRVVLRQRSSALEVPRLTGARPAR